MSMVQSGSPTGSAADALERARNLLAEGHPSEALKLLSTARSRDPKDPWIENARAVCLLRTGASERALEVLRTLVLDDHTVILRRDLDPVLAANFATALLLTGNVEGCAFALSELDASHPAVAPLVGALRDWERGLTRGQRLRRLFGNPPPPPQLTFPPGVVP